MAKKYNKMTPQEQWNAKMSAVRAYEKETNDISPLEQAESYKKRNGHYPWEHMVITKDSNGNLVEKNINKVNYNADVDPSQPIVVPDEQKDKNQSWFARLFGTNKPKNNGPSLPPGPSYVPYQERTQANTKAQSTYPVAPNVQPQSGNEGNRLGKLLNNFISAIKSIGNDINNTSPKEWINTAYNNFAAGAGDVNKAAVNIPRMAWEGYTKLLDKALPDNMYDPNKDVTMQGLNKLYSFYDNTNKQIESKIQNDNPTQQMIGGAVRSMPLMITAMVGGAPLASKAAASGTSGALVKAAELAPFGALAGSNYAGEAKEEGATYGQQVAYGLAGGLAESITEMPFMSSWIDRIGGKKAILNGTENFLQKFGKVGLDYLKDVGSEAWQEAIVDPMTATAKKMIYKPDMPVEGKGGIIDPTQMGEDAIGGSVMAIMMAALHLPANYASRRIAERYVQDRHVPTVNEANLLADQVESDSAQEKTENVNRIVDNFRQAAGVAPKAQGINNQFVNSSENIPKNIPKSNVELPSTQPIQPQVGSIQVTQNLKNSEQPIANNNRSKLFKTVDNIYNINPKLINVDPERFQFKADTDTRTGASKLLKGVNIWNKDLAGTALVWLDKEGKPWIVDGHHRRELAIRTGQPEMPVQILRESDGITDKQARVIGAQRNLANGRGTAADAAKLFRDGNFTLNDLEKSGLSKTEPVVKKGLAIAHLNDRLFHEVISKHLSENQGAIIGEMLPKDGGINDAKQNAIYDEISDKSVSDGVLKEMIDLIKNTDAKGVEQQTLFGTVTNWGIDFKTIPQLIAGIKAKMVNDKNTFGRVIKSESSLKDKGNILNTTENKKTKGLLENALKALDLGKGKAGDPINSVITKYAEMVKAGMPLSEASNQAEKEIVSIMQSGEYISKMLAQSNELVDKPIDGQINIFGGANNAINKRRGSEIGSAYNRGGQEKRIGTEEEKTKSKAKTQVKENRLQKGKLPGPENKEIKLQNEAIDVHNKAVVKQKKLNEIMDKIVKRFNLAGFEGNAKSAESIANKVLRHKNPEYTVYSMKDHARGVIFLNDFSEVPKVVKSLKEMNDSLTGEVSIEKPLNESGYRGIHLVLDLGNNINGEIQLHTNESWKIKKETDKIYEKWRDIDYDDMTPEMVIKRDKDFAYSAKLWNDYFRSVSDVVKRNASSSVKGLAKNSSPTFPLNGTHEPLSNTKPGLPYSSGSESNTLPLSNKQNLDNIISPPDNSITQETDINNDKVKSVLDKWVDTVMPGDVDYKRAYNAYRGTSFEPDRRANEEQQSYVKDMKNVYEELKPLAETDEQKKVLLNELNIYKSKYIEHLNAVLDAKSRTLSVMITGPAKFPTSRNQKALDVADKRVTEFLYWNKKAISSIKKKIKSAMNTEQVSNAEFEKLKKDAIHAINALKDIENGAPYNPSAFRTSLQKKLQRSADNGHIDEVKKVLKWIQKNEGNYLKKPVFAKNNSIWKVLDLKSTSKVEAKNGLSTIGKYNGAEIVKNNDIDRVQIIFNEKPSPEVIDALHKEGWHWSSLNNAWQRKLTSNAEYSANSIIKKFYGNTTGSNDIEIIGNVGFLPPGYSSYRLKRPSNNRSSYTFENAEVEKNWNASHGIKGKPIKSKLNEFFENMKNDFTRTFSTLPEEKEFAKLKFEIVRYPKIRGIAIQSTIRTLDDILSGLNKDMYNTFERKVLLDDLEEEYLLEHDLPNDFTPEIVDDELERIKPYITPEVQEALDKRKQHWDEIKNQYVQAMSDVGFDVSQRFTKESYFRHQVIEYQNLHGGIYGTGKRLRVATQRGFLKQRQGYIGSINTDYLQAEMEVMAQMKADTEIAKMIRRIEKKYSITDALKKEATEIKKRGHTSNVKWKDLIPEGYTTWQPREGRIYYLAYSIPEKIVDSLVDGIGEDLSLDPNDIKKVLAVGQKRKQYVVKQEVADTLNHLFTEKEDVWVSKLSKKILGAWKSWVTGINPKQMAKFNIRNASGDLDAVVGEVPGVLKYVHRATEEIIQARKGFYTKNFGEWVDLGGFEDSLLNSEGIRGVNKLGKFAKLTGYRELNPLKRYKGFAINLSNNREAVLRYAAYLYYKNSIRKNNGKILNYGYSNPKLVNGLDTVEEKAFKLSKDLLGSYDETSVFGRYVSDHLIPFYRWNEVNLTRYIRAIRNAVTDNGNVENIGKAVASKYGIKIIGGAAKRLGKLFIKMFLMTAVISVWNNLFFQKEEDQLSDQVKDKPHLILGRDKDGKISYFSRLGALNDFLEWFGADRLAGDIRDIMNGNKTLKEQVEQMAYAPASKAVNSLNPATKLPFELLLNGKLYPNIQKPQAIRDKGAYIAQSLGLDQEYRNIAGLPHKPYLSTLSDTFLYKSDPEESAYYKIVDLKNKFEVKNGKLPYASYTTSPKSNALYYLKTALKYGDKAAVKKYMQKYIELGGTEKGYKTSMKSLDPLYGLNTNEKTEFMRTLTPQEKETFKRAKKFYDETLDNKISFQSIKNSIKN